MRWVAFGLSLLGAAVFAAGEETPECREVGKTIRTLDAATLFAKSARCPSLDTAQIINERIETRGRQYGASFDDKVDGKEELAEWLLWALAHGHAALAERIADKMLVRDPNNSELAHLALVATYGRTHAGDDVDRRARRSLELLSQKGVKQYARVQQLQREQALYVLTHGGDSSRMRVVAEQMQKIAAQRAWGDELARGARPLTPPQTTKPGWDLAWAMGIALPPPIDLDKKGDPQ